MGRLKILWMPVIIIPIVIATLMSACGCPSGTTYRPDEVEATEFQGVKLTPIREQGNNAIKGTQFIDEATYVLTVDGLVDNPLTLSLGLWTYTALKAGISQLNGLALSLILFSTMPRLSLKLE
jgi:hypothetical protein